ncbi:hypothetical protein D4R42_03945, partial [bacterium]
FYSHTSFALNVATTVAPYVGDACSWLLALLQNKYMLSQILDFSADLSSNMQFFECNQLYYEVKRRTVIF